MPGPAYLKPPPAFDEAGKYEALVAGNARWTSGASAAGVLIWPTGRREAAIANHRPSDSAESNSWRADIGGLVVAVALTPGNSTLDVYIANEELADRANRLFADDQSALLKSRGKRVANADRLIQADNDRRVRNIKVRVHFIRADDERFKVDRESLLQKNKSAMTV